MSNGTTLRPANRCRMASWRASTADCVTSASTSTCSPTSRRHARSSKNGGSTTTPTDRTRALTGLHRLSSQHAPHQGITGTDSPYKRGQVGEQVKGKAEVKAAGDRLYLQFNWDNGKRRGLIDAHREGTMLVGKYINLTDPKVTRP